MFKNFSYKFEKNKIYAIKGESGIGKSTLLNIIAGLINNYKGDIFFNGLNLKTIDKIKWYNKIQLFLKIYLLMKILY